MPRSKKRGEKRAREEGRELEFNVQPVELVLDARRRASVFALRAAANRMVRATPPGTVPDMVRDASRCGHYGVWFSSAWYVVAGIAWREGG